MTSTVVDIGWGRVRRGEVIVFLVSPSICILLLLSLASAFFVACLFDASLDSLLSVCKVDPMMIRELRRRRARSMCQAEAAEGVSGEEAGEVEEDERR